MTTVPEVGLSADVSVMVGLNLGVAKDDIPVAAVAPPPGRLPTAWAVYVVPGVRPVIGQSLGLLQFTATGVPPPTGVSVTV